MNQDGGIRGAVFLDIDEITKRELDLMHPVDEGEVDGLAAKFGEHIVLVEKSSLVCAKTRWLGPSGFCNCGLGSIPTANVSGRTMSKEWPLSIPISR